MFRTIALLTDGRGEARRAYGAAADLSRRFHSRLLLVRVLEPCEVVTPWALEPVPCRPPGSSDLQTEVEHPLLREAGAEPRELEGALEDVLPSFARREAVDLVVLATHGFPGGWGIGGGSFSRRVVRVMPRVLLVPPRGVAAGRSEAESGFAPRRILLARVPGREMQSLEAEARRWAEAFSAEMGVVEVEAEDLAPVGAPEPQRLENEGYTAGRPHPAARILRLRGLPARSIAGAALRYGAQLLVLGVEPGLPGAPPHEGCVTGQVVALSDVPVLIVWDPNRTNRSAS